MLAPDDLAQRLENDWLGKFPASPLESGDLFAAAVSGWFAAATAGGLPCATAAVRRPQLTAQAAGALAAGVGPTSGALLATAVAAYYAGQAFGAGGASFPLALPAGISLFTSALMNLNLAPPDRARQMAQACHFMALSTLVVIPPSPTPVPVT